MTNPGTQSPGKAAVSASPDQARTSTPPKQVLVLDVGGSHLKALIQGGRQPIKIVSGADFTPDAMLTRLRSRLHGRHYDAVSIGIPAPVIHGRVLHEPYNLGKGWAGFDYQAAFGCPVRLINDAAMQALGSYNGKHMLFLGLGTGLGTAMIADGVILPMELAHLPYRRHTFEHYVGEQARERLGGRKWRANVDAVVETLRAALQPDYVVLGGGNVKHLRQLPEGVNRGDNANAFQGGFRLWQEVV